ncbi:hypothetical protein BBAD15_g12149 [Beauveria bassiana D1-5]|uniref:Uncharacterized protein n=1 Tax=Beauveria bassiana D1-5 TaxID=1245745 RepID=A0A0A2V991_BEABA|nr:hypothetical protein BBAD15_g12149 [Beauveria bassiana D1-5]
MRTIIQPYLMLHRPTVQHLIRDELKRNALRLLQRRVHPPVRGTRTAKQMLHPVIKLRSGITTTERIPKTQPKKERATLAPTLRLAV